MQAFVNRLKIRITSYNVCYTKLLRLTNMSSHSIDLSHYFIQTSHQAVAKLNGQNKVSPKGILAPGQSWTILQIAENVQTDPLGNVTNPQGFVNPAFIPMSNP